MRELMSVGEVTLASEYRVVFGLQDVIEEASERPRTHWRIIGTSKLL